MFASPCFLSSSSALTLSSPSPAITPFLVQDRMPAPNDHDMERDGIVILDLVFYWLFIGLYLGFDIESSSC
ncbi:hypothetical protein V8C26DRAFT_417192 [Trichoderma gracile]